MKNTHTHTRLHQLPKQQDTMLNRVACAVKKGVTGGRERRQPKSEGKQKIKKANIHTHTHSHTILNSTKHASSHDPCRMSPNAKLFNN